MQPGKEGNGAVCQWQREMQWRQIFYQVKIERCRQIPWRLSCPTGNSVHMCVCAKSLFYRTDSTRRTQLKKHIKGKKKRRYADLAKGAEQRGE